MNTGNQNPRSSGRGEVKTPRAYQFQTTIDALCLHGPEYPLSGICGNLTYALDSMFPTSGYTLPVVMSILTPIWRQWKSFSGFDRYPVPGLPGYSPVATYNHFPEYMWDQKTTFGRQRRELLDFLRENGVSFMEPQIATKPVRKS